MIISHVIEVDPIKIKKKTESNQFKFYKVF